jgi:hypothetical protein
MEDGGRRCEWVEVLNCSSVIISGMKPPVEDGLLAVRVRKQLREARTATALSRIHGMLMYGTDSVCITAQMVPELTVKCEIMTG